MKPKLKFDPKGLVIIDPIERERYLIETNTSVTPTSSDGNQIPYPVDSTASIMTSGLTISENLTLYVRNSDGTLCREVQPGDDISLVKNEYVLDLSGPLKTYAYVNSAVQIQIGTSKAEISFKEPTRINIGVRSFHRRPAETITTTTNPTDVMQAISMFGSALKTITPERSYPTLRGHPPVFERGDELSIPDNLDQPQTGIKIEIPPTLSHVFAITSLAYYLGAKVVPGPTPQLITETGYHQQLAGEEGFESIVEQVLKQIFFLDCIVRTEGETPSELHGRQAIEPELEFDIEEVYKQSLAEQLEAYLEVPFDTLEPEVPVWYSEVCLEPTTDHIEFLPFIANDLASVKIVDDLTYSPPRINKGPRRKETTHTTGNTSISECDSVGDESDSKYRVPKPVIQQRWKNGNGADISSTKPLAAFRNSITQSPRDDSLKIEVVCNDPSMNDELVTVHSTYKGSNVPYDVTFHHDLSKRELKRVFEKESDFLHYIGHIDAGGFRCSDGLLNAADFESVGTKTVFLNACRSYKQGLELIQAGSISGIVTVTDIQNRVAVAAGGTIAQLLNNGTPLHAALKILQETTGNEYRYHLLGDELSVMANKEMTPLFLAKLSTGSDSNELEILPHVNSKFRPGSIYNPYISVADSYYLVPEGVTFDQVPTADLLEFFNKDEFPVLFEDELRWSTEIKTSEL